MKMYVREIVFLSSLTAFSFTTWLIAAEKPAKPVAKSEAPAPAAKVEKAAEAVAPAAKKETVTPQAKLLATLTEQIQNHAGMTDGVKAYALSTLLPQSVNPVFVAAVKKQNAAGLTMAAIQKIDKEWIDAEEPLPIQTEMMSNATAVELKAFINKNGAIREAFVTDNQGANVGQNALTSDYWQGDEAKWKNAFNGGKGGVDVGKEQFDKSINAPIQQISLPIIDENGAVIGTVTWGLNISSMK